MKKYIAIVIVILLNLNSCCKKTKVIPPEATIPPKQWERYIGVYDVYDTVNNAQWVMEIKHLAYRDQNNGNSDSVLLQNFANRFDIRYEFRYSTDPDRIGLPFIFPLKDKLGYSWSFSGSGEDFSTPYLENHFSNDSIILYFDQSNIAFYQTEGVPYYDCKCKHIAVKRR